MLATWQRKFDHLFLVRFLVSLDGSLHEKEQTSSLTEIGAYLRGTPDNK